MGSSRQEWAAVDRSGQQWTVVDSSGQQLTGGSGHECAGVDGNEGVDSR